MSDEPEITARMLTYYQSIQPLGLDDQGRQLYRCPSRGCGEPAYFDGDGALHCATGDAIDALLADATKRLEAR